MRGSRNRLANFLALTLTLFPCEWAWREGKRNRSHLEPRCRVKLRRVALPWCSHPTTPRHRTPAAPQNAPCSEVPADQYFWHLLGNGRFSDYLAMSRTVFVTVHGTFDGVPNAIEPRWWEPTSAFWRAVCAPSQFGTLTGTVKSFVWSGKNSAFERELAARALASELRALRKDFDNIHLIGHSHGGNVIEDALERIAWNGARRPSLSKHRCPSKVRSVTTLGTPFLDRREPVLRKILIILMLILVVLMALLLVVIGIGVYYMTGGTEQIFNQNELVTATLIGASVIVVLLLPLVLLFIRNWHTLRFRRSTRTPANWLAIFHPQDEAIFLLTSTNNANYEFYQKGVISANVRRRLDAAIIFAASASLILLLAGLAAQYIPGLPAISLFGTSYTADVALIMLGIIALLSTPVFAFVRLFVGLFDMPLRSWFNGQIRGILKGLAFGEDHHVHLVNVAAVPFVFECSGVAVAGPTGDTMASEAKKSFIDYVSTSHQCISWQSAKANTDAIGDMLMGLTSVRTIHSAYFNQPEIAAMIAHHMLQSEVEPEPEAAQS